MVKAMASASRGFRVDDGDEFHFERLWISKDVAGASIRLAGKVTTTVTKD
jgi:hypothetical protein